MESLLEIINKRYGCIDEIPRKEKEEWDMEGVNDLMKKRGNHSISSTRFYDINALAERMLTTFSRLLYEGESGFGVRVAPWRHSHPKSGYLLRIPERESN